MSAKSNHILPDGTAVRCGQRTRAGGPSWRTYEAKSPKLIHFVESALKFCTDSPFSTESDSLISPSSCNSSIDAHGCKLSTELVMTKDQDVFDRDDDTRELANVHEEGKFGSRCGLSRTITHHSSRSVNVSNFRGEGKASWPTSEGNPGASAAPPAVELREFSSYDTHGTYYIVPTYLTPVSLDILLAQQPMVMSNTGKYCSRGVTSARKAWADYERLPEDAGLLIAAGQFVKNAPMITSAGLVELVACTRRLFRQSCIQPTVRPQIGNALCCGAFSSFYINKDSGKQHAFTSGSAMPLPDPISLSYEYQEASQASDPASIPLYSEQLQCHIAIESAKTLSKKLSSMKDGAGKKMLNEAQVEQLVKESCCNPKQRCAFSVNVTVHSDATFLSRITLCKRETCRFYDWLNACAKACELSDSLEVLRLLYPAKSQHPGRFFSQKAIENMLPETSLQSQKAKQWVETLPTSTLLNSLSIPAPRQLLMRFMLFSTTE